MKYLDEGLQLIEEGKLEEGLNKLNIAEKNANHDQLFSLAETYYELGHLQKAQSILENLLELYPDEGSIIVFLAEIYIDLDLEDEAIDYLLEIKDNDDSYLQAQLLLADLYQLQSLDEVAEQKLLAAAKKAPDEVIITYGLGDFYLGRGDYVKAVPFLKKAVFKKDELKGIPIELKLAEAYSASGQFEEALPYYQKGLDEHFEPNALFGYGFTAYQVGDYILAIEQLEALQSLDPDFTTLYPYLAKAQEAENRLDDAMESLRAGMRMDEYNDQLYILAGKLSFKRQRPEEGVSFLQEAIAINPANLEAIQTLAAYFKEQELYEELLDLLHNVRHYEEEGDPLLTWYEADALNKTDEIDQAEKKFREVSEQLGDDLDFLEDYGYFLYEMGYRTEAIEKFEKILIQQPARDDLRQLIIDAQS
ncbi:tetratricopeptide repeat protein [Alkalihalobacillus trypoxylicola]|uniref:Uncharacterized protein n=1 Tax=Alkalihalobacillus trypoxylicola TaxID=519424 RepID=A0A162EH48_9BACI|nr:tetratricopeptide repeat protein [Alkalihalobacillus trypoxylicola]KYG32872.1 hypothetical protein AZF04_18095 [Alkalihalobacillus trypoxylicola]